MNSRDAAYEESIQALLDATAAEALPGGQSSAAKDEPGEAEEELAEIGPGGRRKRKRASEEAGCVIYEFVALWLAH